ncbi:MAG: isoprenyl transferase [Muribaculaceae bacterium]|nr:isoprenyl transferase [Muribaculaceae bacterium]
MTQNNEPLSRIPRHIAIIMDGNGRWAKQRGLDRSAGHVEGVNVVRRITEAASQLGVDYLTLYTFSTENWNRPQQEVDILMHLIVTAIERETPDLIKNGVQLKVIGDMKRLPDEARTRLENCIEETSHGNGLKLVLAISYSSRWEITQAARRIAHEVADAKLSVNDITPEVISRYLSTADMPDPDLLIRTGGDMRVSNFLLWQLAYTELVFTEKYWPDFTRQDLEKAIEVFNRRERRYGLTGEQISEISPDKLIDSIIGDLSNLTKPDDECSL